LHLSGPAVVSAINSVFKTNHPTDSAVTYLSEKEVGSDLKESDRDSVIGINKFEHLLECQMRNDKTMALRMFNYTYLNAIKNHRTDKDGKLWLKFPQAAVIYLKDTGKTSETLYLNFPDGSQHEFSVPAINLLGLSVSKLKEQGLFILLPFLLLRFYNEVERHKKGADFAYLGPEMKALLAEINQATEHGVQSGILTDEDYTLIIDALERLYTELYKPLKGLQEANAMMDELTESRIQKTLREVKERERLAAEQAAERERQVAGQAIERERQVAGQAIERERLAAEQAIERERQNFEIFTKKLRDLGVSNEVIANARAATA
jgi:hypothetical protein